ncbi:fructose-specific PTS transporter subunit EIIC [Spiroplasma alleghenense]|uniref:PTS fructose transporter subunit IIB n=1 Tax=Spiroplasma alleghenense TaxID=216931 RepID=A0A345Z311_9MOLU|nr:fructose-specific PTS transporter subunit EIIC [Spiroplasma alleghenense]AXK50990.1 PTS fructose transporter subunit IIB [Spiroplasma alleghenense]
MEKQIETEVEVVEKQASLKNIVAVTACAAGIAHTYMAADALTKEAKSRNLNIKVETQGTIGAENVLTDIEIANADLVIIAADVKIDLSRFNGKKIFQTGVNPPIKNPGKLIDDAWEKGVEYGKKGTKAGFVTFGKTKRKGVLAHLMTGISWMLPLTIASGLLMAIANLSAFQTEYVDNQGWYTENWVLGTRVFPQFLMDVGSLGFKLMMPIFAGFVAYSIADRPGLAPALVGGWIINDNKMLGVTVQVSENSAIEPGAGFIGAIVVGLLTGYFVQLLKLIRFPKFIQPIVPIMIIPIISTIAIASLVKFGIGVPIAGLVLAMFEGLENLNNQFAGTGIIIALILSMMIAFDLGGPFNKTALVFGTVIFYQTLAEALAKGGTFWDANFVPGTATQAAISVPPLGMWLSTVMFKDRFTKNERIMGTAALGSGAMGITEGAIPFAAADPFRVIFANVVGASVAGVGVTLFNVKFAAGLGSPLGAFLGYIRMDNAPFYPMAWILPIFLGIFITALLTGLMKKKITGEEYEMYLQDRNETRLKRKNRRKNFKLLFTEPKYAFKKFGASQKIWWKNFGKNSKEYWAWIGNGIKDYFVQWGQDFASLGAKIKKTFTKKTAEQKEFLTLQKTQHKEQLALNKVRQKEEKEKERQQDLQDREERRALARQKKEDKKGV